MGKKLSLVLVGLVVLFLASGMNGGCGNPISESNYYYYPNWVPDGRIICFKEYAKYEELGPGKFERIETKYYVTTMRDDGSNEQDLFEISSAIKEITCSPTQELIAYITEPDGEITIANYSGSSIATLSNITDVEYLDWSPDASKIVYSNSSRELYVVERDGVDNIQITPEASGPISWRVGNLISYGYLFVIKPDGTENRELVSGAYPQNYSESEIVYVGSDGVYKIKSDGSFNNRLFTDYDKASLKLSFDNTKIVGGDLYQSTIMGVWVVNIDGSELRQLK